MKKKTNLLKMPGISILDLPITKGNRQNTERRKIKDLGQVTSSELIARGNIDENNGSILLCGDYNKVFSLLERFTVMASHYILVGSEEDFSKQSCLASISCDCEIRQPERNLPEKNVRIVMPTDGALIALKANIPYWKDHLVICCISSSLKLDVELLTSLDQLGSYILVSKDLDRSVSIDDQFKMQDLLERMNYIIVFSIGNATSDLVAVLPEFEAIKVSNAIDVTFHEDSRRHQEIQDNYRHEAGEYPHNGWGVRFGQERTEETRAILTQDELRDKQKDSIVFVYNKKSQDALVAQVTL